jgi:hypothetical protein
MSRLVGKALIPGEIAVRAGFIILLADASALLLLVYLYEFKNKSEEAKHRL